MATTEQVIDDIVRVIDEGSKKFKYGLLWFLIHDLLGNRSDYHYQDLMKLSEKEIHNILKPNIEWSHYAEYSHNWHLYDNIARLRKFAIRNMCHGDNFALIGPTYPHHLLESEKDIEITDIDKEAHIIFDEVDFLADVMYCLLTDNRWARCKIMETVHHAANRVIRNYQEAELIRDNRDLDCLTYVQSYYKRKGIKCKCIW